MEDVSDPPFRALCKENGHVVYTEFISSEVPARDAARVSKARHLRKERPVGIQILKTWTLCCDRLKL